MSLFKIFNTGRAKRQMVGFKILAAVLIFLFSFPTQLFAQTVMESAGPVKESFDFESEPTDIEPNSPDPIKPSTGAAVNELDEIAPDPNEPGPTHADMGEIEEVDEEPIDSESPITPIDSLTEVSDSVETKLYPGVDNSTGALVYSYEISTPPGRNGMSPDISLEYNSINANKDSIIGSGWSINIPYIERFNKEGSNKIYTEDNYSSSLSGELVASSSTAYHPKVSGADFLTYEKLGNGWKVVDQHGVQYLFGTSSLARQDNPSNADQVYKWMLQEVRDRNDNYIYYEYSKIGGQIYPSKITYTGHGTTPGIFEVSFSLESNPGRLNFYNTGFSVVSEYRVDQITTKINGSWARKYTLSYTSGDNAYGSYLAGIVETGKDELNNEVALPATSFAYTTADTDWSGGDTPMPIPFVDLSGDDFGMRTADINGDGLVDILCHNDILNENCGRPNPRIYLNTGTGWNDVSATWLFPIRVDDNSKREGFLDDSGEDSGLRLADVNGDLKVDLVRGRGTHKYTYLNTGSGWTYDSGWNVPLPFINSSGQDYGMRMGDINGDGLPDIVCHNEQTNGNCSRLNPEIFLNNGSGWTNANGSWQFPVKAYDSTRTEVFLDNALLDTGLRLVDVNGDNLSDLVKGFGSLNYTYLNNGSGWFYDSGLSVPLSFIDSSRVDYGVRMADFNGDSLPDFLCHNDQTNGTCSKYNPEFYINTGTGWINANNNWSFPPKFNATSTLESFLSDSLTDTGLRVLDVNGDGIDDLVRGIGGLNHTYLNNETAQSNLLNTIDLSLGGQVVIGYKATPQFRTGSTLLNPNTQVVSHVVSEIGRNSGIGDTATTTYSYEGAEYYYADYENRKFTGFGIVTVTDPIGNKVKTHFHQGNSTASTTGEYVDHISKIGKPYRVEHYDSENNLYSKIINTWDRSDLPGGAFFVKLAATTEFSYDGDGDHKEKAKSFSYNNLIGKITQIVDWGEVDGSDSGIFSDIGADKLTSMVTYAASTTANMHLPSQASAIDQASSTVRISKYYFDNLSHGSIGKGNVTKEESWVSGGTYIDTEKTYNSYGLVTQSKDPRDKVTTYTYDTYNLYPATTTNPLSQTTTAQYDYSAGKPKQVTDGNGYVFQTVFDGLDRVKEEKQPDFATPATLVTKATYDYQDSDALPRAIHKKSYLNSATSTDAYTYVDGFGRVVQERAEAEDSNTFTVKDIQYNSIGKVLKESLPYFGSGASSTAATTTASLYTNYEYDALGRITLIENAVGETTNSYDDWKLTVTDANGEVKHLYKDARDNLVKVEEVNGASTYTTNYEYDGNINLTKITDALGNVRNFTYDGLSRRLTAQDLHASGDTHFGTWYFTYDDAGNVASTTDPKSQNVIYTYDDLNRPLTENYTGQAGTEVTYTYDSCTGGVGLFCTASSTGAYQSNQYFPGGLIKFESKTIDGNTLVTQYTHDRLGNPLTITHPDDFVTVYGYNSAGQIEKIGYKTSANEVLNPLVEDFDYAPTGQVAYQDNANETETVNIYDPAELYRLSWRQTLGPAGVGIMELQDLHYVYDDVGNITEIAENASTTAYRNVVYQYDDLHRLTRASSTRATSNYLETYSYNAIGNLTNKSDLGSYNYTGTTTGSFANPHAATSIAGTGLAYDNNGNLLSYGTQTNVWNYKNQILQTGISGTGTTTSKYDHSGERTIYTDNSGITVYPNRYFDSKGDARTKHIYAGDQLVVTIESQPNMGDFTGGEEESGFEGKNGEDGNQTESCCATGIPYEHNVHYIHPDHLSGTNVVTDALGALEETLDYYPYGKIRIDETVTGFKNSRKFIGEEYDEATSLSYLNSRYLDGARGQFLSQDPSFLAVGNPRELKAKTNLELYEYLANPQGMNSYSYAGNNPIKNSDKSGNYLETGFDLAMFGLSLRDFIKNPGWGTGLGLAADGASLALPIPAVVGAIRHGDDARDIYRAVQHSGMSAKQMVQFGVEFTKNLNFNFTSRAWSAGEVGDNVGSLVDHYVRHGDLVGAKSVGEYYSKANNFIDSGNYVRLQASNGYELWDSKNEVLAVVGKGNEIKSYYKVTDKAKIDRFNRRARGN
jgi:RHS repeat-associated protein